MFQYNLSMVLLCCAAWNGAAHAQVDVQLQGQQEQVYPVYPNATADLKDVAVFKGLLAEKRIVAMGEATHGTKEFFNMKAKVAKYLVQECGFRSFVIEATYGGCQFVNDYVHGSEMAIEEVMSKLEFWTWQTEEVKELVEWMRVYNTARPVADQVSFIGCDMQSFQAPLTYLSHRFEQDSVSALVEWRNSVSPLVERDELTLFQALGAHRTEQLDTLNTVGTAAEDWFVRHDDALRERYGEARLKELTFSLVNYRQAVRQLSARYGHRDSCMALNVASIEQMVQGGVFVWAHNAHIRRAVGEPHHPAIGSSMGEYLGQLYGPAYYAIGFAHHQGKFKAVVGARSLFGHMMKLLFRSKRLFKGIQECLLPPRKRNTLTTALADTDIPAFFVDVAHSGNPLFSKPAKSYTNGATFHNLNWSTEKIVVRDRYDGLVFIESTSSAEPLAK